mmetsp:Transcript_47450/g.133966  ORF Transcript_47450/g.133966 Transcript_47450/m.133966 type:complete len:191 (-) Transcript_47450:78-650(-)
MALAWERIGEAVKKEEYNIVASVFQRELGISEPRDLLPILKGVHMAVLKASKQTSETTNPESDSTTPSAARWKQTVRRMFDADAAVSMLDDLLEAYRREDFMAKCAELQIRYEGNKDTAKKMMEIDAMCEAEVFGPVIQQYGFSKDASGFKEVKDAINEIAGLHDAVKVKNLQVKQLVMSYFRASRAPKK